MKKLKNTVIATVMSLTTLSASASENTLTAYICGTGDTYSEAQVDLEVGLENGVFEKTARELLKSEGISDKAFGFGMSDDYVYEEISYRKAPNGPIFDTIYQVCNDLEVTLPGKQ